MVKNGLRSIGDERFNNRLAMKKELGSDLCNIKNSIRDVMTLLIVMQMGVGWLLIEY